MTAAELAYFFKEELVDVGVTMQQRFSGGFSGNVALVFSLVHAQQLVKTLVGAPLQLRKLSQAEQSALSELANIVLNAAIAVLADQRGERLKVSLPVLAINQAGEVAAQELLGTIRGAKNALILVNHLTIGDTEMIGYLVFLLASTELRHLLDRIVT
ncbi:MAG: Chemotaxis protein, CheC family [uncultured bacterium]|nr:MAG: Chemotaxis protein, CheC family [uncultured bacterium]